MSTIVPVAGDRLTLVANPVELAGRVSSHPLEARGYAPFNCYFLREPDTELLIETGFSVHEEAMVRALSVLRNVDAPLMIWAQRVGEYPSICNAVALIDRFQPEALYSGQERATDWVSFRPRDRSRTAQLARLDTRQVRRDDILSLGSGERPLRVLEAPLRLLPTNWIYDEGTRTLLTADAFTHRWQPTDAGPWIVGADDPAPSEHQILEFLLRSRFWWLAGARTEPLRDAIAEIFEEHDIEVIAPAYGCVIQGRRAVEREVALMDAALALAGDLPATGVHVKEWL